MFYVKSLKIKLTIQLLIFISHILCTQQPYWTVHIQNNCNITESSVGQLGFKVLVVVDRVSQHSVYISSPIFNMMTKPGRPTVQRINCRIPRQGLVAGLRSGAGSRKLIVSQTNFTHSSLSEFPFFFCSPCSCGYMFFFFF